MAEPIFRCEDIRITIGEPAVYSMPSAGSGRLVHLICQKCGTKLWLGFERFPGVDGIYAGTFDEPDWFDVRADNAKQIFIDAARRDSILMPDINAFGQHAMLNDGTPTKGFVLAAPQAVGRR